MLYDKRWDAKVEPLSISAVIAWLEQQPKTKTYCYLDTGHCLAAQYNDSIGREYSTPNPFKMIFRTKSFDVQIEHIAAGRPRTFGAALERARALR